MATYQRSGDCDWCGECCGVETAPNPTSPYPTFPEDYKYMGVGEVEKSIKFAIGMGLVTVLPDGSLDWEPYGSIDIPAFGTAYICFVPHSLGLGWSGLCTNLPPYDDISISSPRCPFLFGDSAPYECALEGRPNLRDDWLVSSCGDRGPAIIQTDEELAQWQTDHPGCSLTFTEV